MAPSTTVQDTTRLMLKHKIGGLPVTIVGKLVGIVTTTDMLKAFLHIVETGGTRSDIDAEAGGIRYARAMVIERYQVRGKVSVTRVLAQRGEVVGVVSGVQCSCAQPI